MMSAMVLYERMYKKQRLREQFLDQAERLKKKAAAAYQRHIDRFQSSVDREERGPMSGEKRSATRNFPTGRPP
jgi:hypothetical protein